MKAQDVFSSNYLNAAALQGKTPIVTIERVEMEDIGKDDKQERKPVVYFKGSDRGLALNRTNFNSLVEFTGQDDTDNWPGHRVKLITAMVDYQGKRVPAIRIEAANTPTAQPRQQAAPARRPAPPPPPVAFEEVNTPDEDSIPF
jgi:hypothetical protein